MSYNQHSQNGNTKLSAPTQANVSVKAAPMPPAVQEQELLPFARKVRWFALGLFGGIFGMVGALIFQGSLTQGNRKQAEWATWAGFAINMFCLVLLINTGCIDAAIQSLSGAAAAPAPVQTSLAFG